MVVAVLTTTGAAGTAAFVLAGGGAAAKGARVGEVSFQPCLSFKLVRLNGSGDDTRYRPSPRRALTDAIAGQPSYVFSGAKAQEIPPHGDWQVDAAHSKKDEIQFDHVSSTGAVDWVALVGYAEESGVNLRPEHGWQYEIGSTWPSHYKQVPC